ncbi:hypothetical protein KCU61_g122, partial [Aureobasidium melanogenum]
MRGRILICNCTKTRVKIMAVVSNTHPRRVPRKSPSMTPCYPTPRRPRAVIILNKPPQESNPDPLVGRGAGICQAHHPQSSIFLLLPFGAGSSGVRETALSFHSVELDITDVVEASELVELALCPESGTSSWFLWSDRWLLTSEGYEAERGVWRGQMYSEPPYCKVKKKNERSE